MSDLIPAVIVAVLIFLTYGLAVWLKHPNRREYR